MKLFWLLLCCIGTCYGGVVPWTRAKEDQAIALFLQYCAGGSTAHGTTPDGARWDCKIPEETETETLNHKKTVNIDGHNSKQIVFIQTPSKKFVHNVLVEGEAEFNHDTDIYVVPGKDDHQLDIQADIRTKEGKGGKPHTLFLKNNPLSGGDSSGAYPVSSHYAQPEAPKQLPTYNYGNNRRHRRKLAVKVKKAVPAEQQEDDESEEVIAPAEVVPEEIIPQVPQPSHNFKSGNGSRRIRKKLVKVRKPVPVKEEDTEEDFEGEQTAASNTVNKFSGFQDFQPFQF